VSGDDMNNENMNSALAVSVFDKVRHYNWKVIKKTILRVLPLQVIDQRFLRVESCCQNLCYVPSVCRAIDRPHRL
jgi:hypothetical protein